jgi:tRNA A64-2'-O-ribosylphosphate transferase
MHTSEEDAPALIAKLIDEEAVNGSSNAATLVHPTTSLYISSSQNIDLAAFDIVVSCAQSPFTPDILKVANVTHYLNLKCQTGKLGSRDLRTTLPLLPSFLSSIPPSVSSPKILICCPTGTDLAVGTALAMLCLYSSEAGMIDLSTRRSARDVDKNFIKQRLTWITTSNPALNPSRATLQSVNAVLLTSQDPKTAELPVRSGIETRGTNNPLNSVSITSQDSKAPSIPTETTPSNIFHALSKSKWSFHRMLTSALPTHPSGIVTGTATFTPHTSHSVPTLVYAEDGTFVTTTGLEMRAKRKYVYQLQTGVGQDGEVGIVVKFFDDEARPRSSDIGPQGEGIGGMFVEMARLERSADGVWEAKSKETHLCGEDLYAAGWRFEGGMAGETERDGEVWWEVKYDVQGPRKGYVSSTRYEPVAA